MSDFASKKTTEALNARGSIPPQLRQTLWSTSKPTRIEGHQAKAGTERRSLQNKVPREMQISEEEEEA